MHEKLITSVHEKVITSVDPGGYGSTIEEERINSQLSLLHEKAIAFSLLHKKAIASVDPGRGGSMIDKERINRQLSLSHEKAITSVDSLVGGSDQ